MADIVERLRTLAPFEHFAEIRAIMLEAADTIARQREEIVRLRATLEWYGENARLCRLVHSGGDGGRSALNDDGGKRARSALSDTTAVEGKDG